MLRGLKVGLKKSAYWQTSVEDQRTDDPEESKKTCSQSILVPGKLLFYQQSHLKLHFFTIYPLRS